LITGPDYPHTTPDVHSCKPFPNSCQIPALMPGNLSPTKLG
jgi:hypothetical protein